MQITKVTMTGADDKINIADLVELSNTYPFVEWAILVSRNAGKNRFPSRDWRFKLNEVKKANPQLQLSCHLCGAYVPELLNGISNFFWDNFHELEQYERLQINTHAEKYKIVIPELVNALVVRKFQYIVQYDGVNGETILNGLRDAAIDAVPLFDLSHGTGVSPDAWPAQIKSTDKYGFTAPLYCGYAGGLGPDNIIDELKRIDKAVEQNAPIWIDMETKIRSNNDQDFDFDKIVQCLEAAKPYVV
jgi:hypothetical protein